MIPDVERLVRRVVQERAPSLRELVPEAGPALARLVDDCLDPNPSRRPSGGIELARRVEAAMTCRSRMLVVDCPPALSLSRNRDWDPLWQTWGFGATRRR